jgi:hypothetical protein
VGRYTHIPERGDGALHRLPGVGRGGVRKHELLQPHRLAHHALE